MVGCESAPSQDYNEVPGVPDDAPNAYTERCDGDFGNSIRLYHFGEDKEPGGKTEIKSFVGERVRALITKVRSDFDQVSNCIYAVSEAEINRALSAPPVNVGADENIEVLARTADIPQNKLRISDSYITKLKTMLAKFKESTSGAIAGNTEPYWGELCR